MHSDYSLIKIINNNRELWPYSKSKQFFFTHIFGASMAMTIASYMLKGAQVHTNLHIIYLQQKNNNNKHLILALDSFISRNLLCWQAQSGDC